jgi:NADP-dependent 3-hydroxy acid dehydrogenase YdfG
MQKVILVTGATSGFGKAIATKFASEGYSVVITGRLI